MDLCDLEAVLVYLVSSQAMKTKTWDPAPPQKGKRNKEKRKLHGCKRREGAVHFKKDCSCHANQACSLAEQGHITVFPLKKPGPLTILRTWLIGRQKLSKVPTTTGKVPLASCLGNVSLEPLHNGVDKD